MKYIKKFENNTGIQNLIEHIVYFMSKYHDNIDYVSHEGDYNFYYIVKQVQNKYFLNIKLDIYKHPMMIRYNIDNIIQNPGWINETITNISYFIKSIFDMYKKQTDKKYNYDIVDYSDIDNIIREITKNNYEIYLNSLKYNL